MRITRTTRAPVRAKEITAAGPAAPMTTPLPTNRPAPITPPSAIICMCRRRSERRNPVLAVSSVVSVDSAAMAPPRARLGSGVLLVFREVTDRFRQGIAPERVPELLRHHHLEHRRLAIALRSRCRAQGRGDVAQPLYGRTLAAEGPRYRSPAGILEVHALVAARVEVDVVFLLRAPLGVIEQDDGHPDALAGTGQQFVETDSP